MRLVVQRVSEASVIINNQIFSSISAGLLVFLGIEDNDNLEDIVWLCSKLVNLRIFSDSEGIMNISIKDISGEFLIVSQFTLQASTKKGNRPSYIRASKPDIAIPLYETFIDTLSNISGLVVKTGQFGADMKVNLINDGPITIIFDTKNKE